MQITTFGIVWVLILSVVSIWDRKAFTGCVLFSALFQSGAVLILGDAILSPLACSCLFYVFRSFLFHSRDKKIRIPIFFQAFVLFWEITLAASILSSIIFPGTVYMESLDWVQYGVYDGHISLYGMLTLLLYGITALLMYNDPVLGEKDIHRLMDICVLFVLLIGIWQCGSIMGYIPRNAFMRDLIYSNATTIPNIAYFHDTARDGYGYSTIFSIRFYSCFMEASYCASFLGVAFFYYISLKELRMIDRMMILLILGMTIMTFSSTAYIVVLVGGFLAFITTGRIRQALRVLKRGGTLFLSGAAVVTVCGFWGRVLRATIDKAGTHSASIRRMWDMYCLQTFFDTYGIGLGFANVRASSVLCTLLGSQGLLGTICFFIFFSSILLMKEKEVKEDKKNRGLSAPGRCKCMLIIAFLSQIVSIGQLDHTIFWMCLLLVTAFINGSDQRTCLGGISYV